MSIARWASARLRWASCCYPLALRCRLPRPKWLRGPTAAQEPHCFESRSPRQPNAPRFRHRRLRRNRYGIAAIGAGAERDMYGCRGTISNARSPTPTGSPVTGNRRPTAGRGSKAVGARDAAARGTSRRDREVDRRFEDASQVNRPLAQWRFNCGSSAMPVRQRAVVYPYGSGTGRAPRSADRSVCPSTTAYPSSGCRA